MFGIENFATFLLASVAVIVAPGPATLFVAARAQISSLDASVAAIGIILGDIILMSISGLGLSSVITQWPSLLLAIRILGAIYIAWLGISAIASSSAQRMDVTATQTSIVATGKASLLLTLANPKPILFFAAFLPLFIGAHPTSWATSYTLLGAIYEVINVMYYTLLILVVSKIKHVSPFRGANPKWRQRLGGLALIACATLVLFSSTPNALP